MNTVPFLDISAQYLTDVFLTLSQMWVHPWSLLVVTCMFSKEVVPQLVYVAYARGVERVGGLFISPRFGEKGIFFYQGIPSPSQRPRGGLDIFIRLKTEGRKETLRHELYISSCVGEFLNPLALKNSIDWMNSNPWRIEVRHRDLNILPELQAEWVSRMVKAESAKAELRWMEASINHIRQLGQHNPLLFNEMARPHFRPDTITPRPGPHQQ